MLPHTSMEPVALALMLPTSIAVLPTGAVTLLLARVRFPLFTIALALTTRSGRVYEYAVEITLEATSTCVPSPKGPLTVRSGVLASI